MAMVMQLHKCLLSANSSKPPTVFCCCIRNINTSTSFRGTMWHDRALWNFPAAHSPCSSFGTAATFERLSDPSIQKFAVSCIQAPVDSKVLRLKPRWTCFNSRNRSFEFRDNLRFQSQSKIGLFNCSKSAYIFSYLSLNGSFGNTAPDYANSAKRFVSHIPEEVSEINGNPGAKGGKKGWTKSFFFVKQYKRKVKLLAQKKDLEVGGTNSSKSNLSSLKDVGTASSVDQHVKDIKEEVNSGDPIHSLTGNGQVPKLKGKTKQESKSKTRQDEPLASNAALNDATPQGGSKRISQPKKSVSTKNDRPSMESEKNTKANPTIQVADSSFSKKERSKRAANNTRKQTSTKEADVPKKSDEGIEVSSGIELPFKREPGRDVQVKALVRKGFRPLYPPAGKSVLIVESVTKAKVIQEYLGEMFEVLPSYGHVRDLAARSGSVRPEEDFSMVWEVPAAAWTHLKSIKVALTGTENLILASDPDREGEAIAWHIIEMLQQQNALRDDITVARVVFNEITESSIKKALQAPRDIDVNLVHSYLARRALDYLIGFNISPLLWRKLPGCQSAGRVQSAALSLICDRETDIDDFNPQEYWTVKATFLNKYINSSPDTMDCPSNLTHFDFKKLDQLSIISLSEAKKIEQAINSSNFEVVGTSKSISQKNPPNPYITSTLQQDGSNRLHFSTAYTMKLAQKLYEGVKLSDNKSSGLITYMRTDGFHISSEATKDIRSMIVELYGKNFVSESDRKFYKKVKNAQEAHEAIRPTDIRKLPSTLAGVLDEDSLKLYTLIWSRSIACQMEPAIIEQIQVDIGNADKSIVFRSTCSKVGFLGFQAVYNDAETATIRDDIKNYEFLSNLKSRDPMELDNVEVRQHNTLPPPRYSEASLVKKLEELGIGRPSTYATIIKVLKDRNYVTIKSRVLYPEFRGRMVSAFLSHHFTEVADYSFTADMETELDNVSAGLTEWKGLLRDYWTRFSMYCDRASNVPIQKVEKMLEKTFGDFLFASLPKQNRACPSCHEGTLIFKVSRFGAGYFIGCDQHPKCKYIAKTLYGDDDDDVIPEESKAVEPPKFLGFSPGSSEKVLLKDGPYGHYVQLGEDRKGYSPKRASVAQIKDLNCFTLEDALQLLRYPVTLGNHPEDCRPVILRLGQNGFSIKHRRTNAPVPKNTDPNDVTLEKALKYLKSKNATLCGRPKKDRTKQVEEAFDGY